MHFESNESEALWGTVGQGEGQLAPPLTSQAPLCFSSSPFPQTQTEGGLCTDHKENLGHPGTPLL